MTWVKFSDNWNTQAVPMAMGLEGRALYRGGIHYIASGQTEGHIAEAAVVKIGVLEDVTDVQRAVATVVDLGAWQREPGGYFVPDWTCLERALEYRTQKSDRCAAGRHIARGPHHAGCARGVHVVLARIRAGRHGVLRQFRR
jgi:hypothetical protein